MNAPMKKPRVIPERQERRAVSLQAFIVRANHQTSEIELLDLSYEGCGIATSADLKPGERIKMSVMQRGVIDAQVRWFREGKAGLVFTSSHFTSKTQRERISSRFAITADVSLRRRGMATYGVRVVDLSAEGCKVELVERPRGGESMTIKFEGLESMDAEVCWIEGFQAGLRFQRPIHPAVFELLLTRLRG
jgi:hypothetical protein